MCSCGLSLTHLAGLLLEDGGVTRLAQLRRPEVRKVRRLHLLVAKAPNGIALMTLTRC